MNPPTPAFDGNRALPGASASGHAPPGAPPAPAYLNLDLPSVDTPWRYAWTYARAALGSLLGPHRMRSGATNHYRAPMKISPHLAGRWRALFDVPVRAAARVPLLTGQGVGTLMYARLFADLGIDLRHLQHQLHRTVHHAGVQATARARDQHLSCHVQRVLRLGEDRVLVEVRTVVHDAAGQLLCEVEDGFVVDRLPLTDLGGLPSDSQQLRELLGVRRRLPRLSSLIGQARLCQMPVPAHLGRRYARVAGDMNPAHCCRLGAWLMGARRPYLQGLALRNLVVRHLAELGVSMERLALTFVAPALLGQTLMLVVEGEDFEVHDARGHLLAFGSATGA